MNGDAGAARGILDIVSRLGVSEHRKVGIVFGGRARSCARSSAIAHV